MLNFVPPGKDLKNPILSKENMMKAFGLNYEKFMQKEAANLSGSGITREGVPTLTQPYWVFFIINKQKFNLSKNEINRLGYSIFNLCQSLIVAKKPVGLGSRSKNDLTHKALKKFLIRLDKNRRDIVDLQGWLQVKINPSGILNEENIESFLPLEASQNLFSAVSNIYEIINLVKETEKKLRGTEKSIQQALNVVKERTSLEANSYRAIMQILGKETGRKLIDDVVKKITTSYREKLECLHVRPNKIHDRVALHAPRQSKNFERSR